MPAPGYAIGRDNLEAVREFFVTHLCCTQIECAKALNLSQCAVNRHVKTLRSEWRPKPVFKGKRVLRHVD